MSLLGFLGKVATGFVAGGPIGAIAGGASHFIKPGGAAPAPPRPMISSGLPMSAFPVIKPLVLQDSRQSGIINIMTNRPQLPALPGGAPRLGPGNQTQSGFGGQAGTAGAACERGYHRNKTGYYTKRYGWVPEGSVCVKNRRRNPLNPRALSRSISRITSAKRAAGFLSRVTVRERSCGCK